MSEPVSSPGAVLVVGAGLIGTSVGLALAAAGTSVGLVDVDAAAVRLAVALGAGAPDEPGRRYDLVVVAVPPARTAAVVAELLRSGRAAAVTDVASVKADVRDAVARELGSGGTQLLGRFVGSHPMAGRERAGAGAARHDLFVGRVWVLTPDDTTAPETVDAVRRLARAVGATPLLRTAEAHDRAVALVSHAPHLVASALAARLLAAGRDDVELAGQGLRDTTRIAEGDPVLWGEILAANADAVADVLTEVIADLGDAVGELRRGGAQTGVQGLLSRGLAGRAALPGKHGSAATDYVSVPVVVPDRPAQLARLFTDVGEAGVNIEDMRIEHAPGAPVGLVELVVAPSAVAALVDGLAARGWDVHA